MQCEVAAARWGCCASGGVALSGRHGRHVSTCQRTPRSRLQRLFAYSSKKSGAYFTTRHHSAPSLNAQKMRQADDDDEGIEMGGTLDPEDGLQGIASKARPMPKW